MTQRKTIVAVSLVCIPSSEELIIFGNMLCNKIVLVAWANGLCMCCNGNKEKF